MWATESFFYNSGRRLVLEEMQHDANTPRMRHGEGATANCSRHCTICWSMNSGHGICIFGLQQRLQKPLETVSELSHLSIVSLPPQI
jgi:hypothetical protein